MDNPRTIILIAGVLSLLWGAGLCLPGSWGPNLVSVIGCLLVLPLGWRAFQSSSDSPRRLNFLLIFAGVFHFGFVTGIGLFDSTETLLWVTDSYNLHIPGAERLLDWFQQGEDIERSSIYDRTYLAHILVAIFFAIFGVSQWASGLALIIPKLIATAFVFKGAEILSDKKTATLAALIFILLPTAVFYTLTYYKEATVQMYVAILFYLLARLSNQFSWRWLLVFLFALGLAGLERHYLVPCFVVGLSLLFFLDRSKPDWFRLIPFPLGFLCYLAYMYKYDDMAMVTVMDSLVFYRDAYHSYADVDSINRALPYPVAFIKLYLTPIFTPRKLDMFFGFSSLLTWGSFLYQGVALTALLGAWHQWKNKGQGKVVALMWTPLIVLLLVFAFVAPYNGRLRDSFLPVLVAFSALGWGYLNSIGYLKFFCLGSKK